MYAKFTTTKNKQLKQKVNFFFEKNIFEICVLNYISIIFQLLNYIVCVCWA